MESSNRVSLAGLFAAFALVFTMTPARASAASNVEITSATLSSASPCPGNTYTLTITLQDLVNTPSFTPYIYAAEEPSAFYSCADDGFNTSTNPPYIYWWDIDSTTNPLVAPAFGYMVDGNGWPNDGGWEAPVALSYTGQTFTQSFQVMIGATDLANRSYQFEIGASSGPQGATGADSYYCLTFGTCSYQGSMVPSSTPTLGSTPTATPTQGIPVPTATTTAPTPVAGALTPAAVSAASVSVRPNFMKANETTTITVRSASGGTVDLRLLRQNGEQVRGLWQGELQPQGSTQVTWDGRFEDGSVAPSGVYYVAFTDGDGKNTVEKLLIVR